MNCRFKRYGEEEKICARCGYVIPICLKDDEERMLKQTIKNCFGDKPKCEDQ